MLVDSGFHRSLDRSHVESGRAGRRHRHLPRLREWGSGPAPRRDHDRCGVRQRGAGACAVPVQRVRAGYDSASIRRRPDD
jgi:hypothetical protein